MNFQDDIAQFVQDRGRVRMGQVSWWWASRLVLQLWTWETSICLTLREVPSEIADGCEDLATKF